MSLIHCGESLDDTLILRACDAVKTASAIIIVELPVSAAHCCFVRAADAADVPHCVCDMWMQVDLEEVYEEAAMIGRCEHCARDDCRFTIGVMCPLCQ